MKPYGRQTKKKVFHILSNEPRSQALEMLEQIPDEQLVGHLFSHFYHMDELVKFRSATAMGHLVLRLSGKKMEKARVVLRRIMWNLNDESGGIGWGSPEAMGEILSKSPELAKEFKSILFSYLVPGGNHIEHDILQRGVLWGIGTYLEAAPQDLPEPAENQIYSHLHSPDPIKRGFAVQALINAQKFDCRIVPEHISADVSSIYIYTGWNFVETRISDMVHACTNHRAAG
jgi:DNA-binding transcriptional ArsR family regulator